MDPARGSLGEVLACKRIERAKRTDRQAFLNACRGHTSDRQSPSIPVAVQEPICVGNRIRCCIRKLKDTEKAASRISRLRVSLGPRTRVAAGGVVQVEHRSVGGHLSVGSAQVAVVLNFLRQKMDRIGIRLTPGCRRTRTPSATTPYPSPDLGAVAHRAGREDPPLGRRRSGMSAPCRAAFPLRARLCRRLPPLSLLGRCRPGPPDDRHRATDSGPISTKVANSGTPHAYLSSYSSP